MLPRYLVNVDSSGGSRISPVDRMNSKEVPDNYFANCIFNSLKKRMRPPTPNKPMYISRTYYAGEGCGGFNTPPEEVAFRSQEQLRIQTITYMSRCRCITENYILSSNYSNEKGFINQHMFNSIRFHSIILKADVNQCREQFQLTQSSLSWIEQNLH